MSLLRGRSATEGYFRTSSLCRHIAAAGPFDLAVGYCSATLPALLAAPAKRRIMDLVDVDSAKWSAYAQAAGGLTRWLYRTESHRVAQLERTAVDRCDAVLLVSDAEVAALTGATDTVMAVGNGVDLDRFTPFPPAEAPSIVFTGTMDYRPNVEGVCWFVREVWPRLRAAVPAAIFTIVGRDPARPVRRLAEIPGVRVTGWVADVQPYLAAASVAVAPLHIARGVQNKVLEAMACGRAVVATGEALAGLDVRVGVDVLQAADGDEWVQCLTDLLSDRSRIRQLGAAAADAVARRYTWSARMAPLVDLCRRLADEQ
jgi:sugar transferase (PEP-CTERM/EpsH1 system associated)